MLHTCISLGIDSSAKDLNAPLALQKINPFRTAVPAEGTYKHYIVLRSMANYNNRRKLPILPEMV